MSEESNASKIVNTSDKLFIYYGSHRVMMGTTINKFKSELIYRNVSEKGKALIFIFRRANTGYAKQSESYSFKIDIICEYF